MWRCYQQLFSGAWMNMPQGIPNCPPGLEYLTQIDQLLVHQKVELLEGNHFSEENLNNTKMFVPFQL